MHVVELIADLKKELEIVFKDYEYLNKDGSKNPQIKSGYMTVKRNIDDFPYILLSPIGETTDRENSQIRIMFIVGTWDKEETGWQDVALMSNKIKMFLKKDVDFQMKYNLEIDKDKIEIIYPDAQPYPQWFCFITATFNVPNIEDVSDSNMLGK